MIRRIFFLTTLLLGLFNISPGYSQSGYAFIENKGQWSSQVKFRTDIPGGKLFLNENSLNYLFYDFKLQHDIQKNKFESLDNQRIAPTIPNNKLEVQSIKLEFVNASPKSIVPAKSLSQSYNYIKGNNPKNWSNAVNTYSEVLYNNLYPGVDLKYYSYDGNLKYDLIVAPHSDPKQIAFKYSGMDKIFLKNGSLYIKSSNNQIIENKPYTYQLVNGDTVNVSCRYKFDERTNTISFEFPENYDNKIDLIIDPILIFSTYSGSTADNWGFSATHDAHGNLYSGGIVFNPGLPTTTGAYQINFSDSIDIAIMKFDSSGQKLLYGTYLGGTGVEAPSSLVVNERDELYILGSTSSDDFPTTNNAFDKTFNGGQLATPVSGVTYGAGADLIVSKLSQDGSTLLASTYIGGSLNDGLSDESMSLVINYGDGFRGDILVEKDFIYITSQSQSVDFPTKGGFQNTYGGGENDGVILKMDDQLSDLIWSSYIGGQNADASYSVKVDSMSNVIIGGGTSSSDFPTTNSGVNPNISGNIDGFIAKIHSSGSSLLSSTYLGTPSYDQVYIIDIDFAGNAYAVGQTTGSYPVTANTYSVNNGGQFIHKLSPDLDKTEFSTVFGRPGSSPLPNLTLTAFMVSDCENIYLAGWGSTRGTPITPDAFQRTTDNEDFYLMVLAKNAESLLYATFFGGGDPRGFEHVDGGTSRFDKKGIVYQAVCGGCLQSANDRSVPSYPTTAGAWSQTNRSDNCNMAAFKFDLSLISISFNYDSEYKECQTLPYFTFTNNSLNAEYFHWDFGDGTTSTEENPVHQYKESGHYSVTLRVGNKFCEAFQKNELDAVALIVPNVFTPNGDGVNDFFEIKSQYPLTVQLFNRWGKQVYQSENYQNDWDGKDQPSGTYFYSVKDKNILCKGWVQILK